ncbi:MAG TPA: pyruvate:ferredoxin (flavodoxin) oxidoreductase [Anaerolineaceae bacterium]|nr:pyruvate:ferredoxin (flavodoxin) oxidoreductase [Anaerolineaceae bacterium]
MAKRPFVTVDGNEAIANVAYQVSEVVAIYPITPSSPMAELADKWAASGRPNIWGAVPRVVEMQSEGGAAGAVHGSLQGGALTTTFTASQGLLLMIPNMYKIAGELTSTVFHIAARSLAAQALSIFGDHSDVMAARATGFGMLFSANPQEAQDMALIAHASTLEARVPFLHIMDGFRTSHEIRKIEQLTPEDIGAMISDELVRAHRDRALNPDHPFIRGTSQNPDVYFQARESVNPYYLAVPEIVRRYMDKFYELTGRRYELFQYVGAPDAERVIVLMGSGADTAHETVEYLTEKMGEKVGVLKVRLYRPFSMEHFIKALPPTVKAIAVLDRTKEPGSTGEPLYLDVVAAVEEAFERGVAPFAQKPKVVGGRYGLSSKEFNPAMVKGVFDELTKASPKNHFTVGIYDDVTHTSIDYDPSFSTEDPETIRAVFYGLGSDGTVSANKNSIKIIGTETDYYAQGYFVYDSKKAGAITVSHLRFGPKPIRSTYLISRANFVACHQFAFLERMDVLKEAEPGATFLLNSPYGPDEVWDHLPKTIQKEIIDKKLRFFVVDGYRVARETGMGLRINTILQTCFFAISGVLPRDEAIEKIKQAIRKTYGKKGEDVVRKNFAAVDAALEHLHEVKVPDKVTATFDLRPPVPPTAPEFVQKVTAKMIAREGDALPVSALPADGTYPSGTTRYEKRNIALEIPVWEPDLCIQCGKCVMICPHSVIRAKVYDPVLLEDAPPTFKHMEAKWRQFKGMAYTIQVAPEDCTGCTLCVEVCPAVDKNDPTRKALNMAPQAPLREQEAENWDFFLNLPDPPREQLKHTQVKDIQLMEPLFEFSGACAGCGETPYLSLLTRLFGDRIYVANATGCSSIYGGNLPTTPWAYNKEGYGPAWSNSLFEDNAEFGLGMRLALDKQADYARYLLQRIGGKIGDQLVDEILNADQSTEEGIKAQRQRVALLLQRLEQMEPTREVLDLKHVAHALVRKSVWIVGGDGWAYDIGYGGLDHVLASGLDVNILVLDTEVYSNTGGQASKATPRGAVAKFAAAGKGLPKKDLILLAMTYGNVYAARVAMGAKDTQTVKAFLEADSYPGPSIIVAYSHCIEHGYDMRYGAEQQQRAVDSGYWPLVRFDPRRIEKDLPPLQLDSRDPKISLEEYIRHERRYMMLLDTHPDRAEQLLAEAQRDVQQRWQLYKAWSQIAFRFNGDE